MAIPVIKVPAAPVRLRLGTLALNEFDRTLSLVFVQVDQQGEQIKGGTQIPGRTTGPAYTTAVAPWLEGVVAAALADMISSGQIDKDSIVELIP